MYFLNYKIIKFENNLINTNNLFYLINMLFKYKLSIFLPTPAVQSVHSTYFSTDRRLQKPSEMKETISAITNINCFLVSILNNNDHLCNYHLYIVHYVTVLVADINKSFFHSRI